MLRSGGPLAGAMSQDARDRLAIVRKPAPRDLRPFQRARGETRHEPQGCSLVEASCLQVLLACKRRGRLRTLDGPSRAGGHSGPLEVGADELLPPTGRRIEQQDPTRNKAGPRHRGDPQRGLPPPAPLLRSCGVSRQPLNRCPFQPKRHSGAAVCCFRIGRAPKLSAGAAPGPRPFRLQAAASLAPPKRRCGSLLCMPTRPRPPGMLVPPACP